MKIISESPITILAEDGFIIVPKNVQPTTAHIANSLITLAKNDNINNYIEVNISAIIDKNIENFENIINETI